jgi:ataxia telangiectasia mutated family protein
MNFTLKFMHLAPTRLGFRYRPNDMKAVAALNALKAKRSECDGQVQPLLKLFLQIQAKLQPVMRHYFTEKRKKPMSWFAMRLNYIRSVATTSIVGHILGLGDRHGANILIDNGSGEVVHIDLGIAFEQVRQTTFCL